MKLAYSTNAFTRFGLPEALREIAALGYSGVEILCDQPHWFPERVGSRELEEVRSILAETGLTVCNLNANTANGHYSPLPPENLFEPALTHPDPDWRRWREEFTRAALRLAKEVGAPCVSLTSGHPTPGCEPEQALDHFVESLRRLCEFAEQCEVRIGIEYEPGLLVERAQEVVEVLERVGSPFLGVNLDIGHSHLQQEPVEQTIAALAGRIWNVHVEDIRGRKHFHRVPGDGDLPFERYFRALRSVGYPGFLTVELYSYPNRPIEAGREALAHLRTLLEVGS